MKKIFLSVALLILLTSCGNTETQLQFPLSIERSVSTVYHNIEFKADLMYDNNGKVVFDLTAPAELKGLKFVVDNEVFSVLKDDVMVDYSAILFENCPFSLLSNAIYALNSQKPEFRKNGDTVTSLLNVDGMRCQIQLDAEDFNITQILVGGCKFNFFNRGT